MKIADKSNPDAIRRSVACQALSRISQIYKLEGALKDLTAGERLRERQNSIKSLVKEYFAWIKSQLKKTTVPPKGETVEGLRYSLNQEKYLRVFLADGKVPIDNSASERSIRTLYIGKKNQIFHDSIQGAQASAVTYSISETTRPNNLRPYYYFRYLLTELPKRYDEKGNIDSAKLNHLLPRARELPAECRKPRH